MKYEYVGHAKVEPSIGFDMLFAIWTCIYSGHVDSPWHQQAVSYRIFDPQDRIYLFATQYVHFAKRGQVGSCDLLASLLNNELTQAEMFKTSHTLTDPLLWVGMSGIIYCKYTTNSITKVLFFFFNINVKCYTFYLLYLQK